MEELGRYLVRGQIGKGGFGAVYRAWDPLVGREVAIKLLTSVHDPSMLARFRFEAGTTGKLKHKNIVTIYDFGVHEAAPYLVMELLDGRSLREVIESAVPLSLLDKVAILAEIARGLMYAHQNGVIHRDVKPANVMQVVDGTVKILDFGIARMADPDLSRQTSTGVLVGTPLYMAPEQFAGEDATAVSDIFSFGVLGYELLCGEHPFRAPNPVATMNLVSNKELTPLRESIADYPAPLDSVLLKAVAKRPSERYQSLQDLLFDLAPIEAQLRRNHADCQAQEAQRWLAGGDLASAQQSLWRALEADPSHARSHELRREIQCRRDRIVLEQRFQAAVRELEELLQRGCFDEAIAGLESVRELVSTDEAGDLRADLDARFDAARAGRERVRQIAVVQAAVRESEELLQRGCFDEAIAGLESVRELLSTDGAGDLRADLDARLVAARAG